jgi:hypothetical protein
MHTKQSIIDLLKNSDKAVARALVVLTARQTSDEQACEGTKYLNGRGFRPQHARMGTSMAKFFQRNNYLSAKQLAYWRVPDRSGTPRICIYAGQLLEEAKAKSTTPKPVAIVAEDRDYGNDMERRMVLGEILSDVMDSDDPAIINPVVNEIDEIDAFWNKVRAQT